VVTGRIIFKYQGRFYGTLRKSKYIVLNRYEIANVSIMQLLVNRSLQFFSMRVSSGSYYKSKFKLNFKQANSSTSFDATFLKLRLYFSFFFRIKFQDYKCNLCQHKFS